MAMKEPPHPGNSVRFDCLEPLGLSVTKGAEILGVTRQALNNLVTPRQGFRRRWRSASTRLSVVRPKDGSPFKRPLILHRCESTRSRST